ncbi:MAG: methylmalonyl Co-A mutase-associated GTPase MeaB [Sandaracinaceae bacterium]|nr:methylmalonyl Co-A mutase-associated GTPase MeaB [Sandaracinaceae bacterium]
MSPTPVERLANVVEGVRAGRERAIARAMRVIDERGPQHRELLQALAPYAGRARVIGVTGTPGAGKSTLVNELVACARKSGQRVGVVAVDPTSPYTGGAILGDRIRMQRHFLDEGVFIRSLATRGHLGGLSRSAADVITVLDAAGFDLILVETVGVGQDELEIAQLAQTTVVVVTPGLGDDIQAIKAGILEIADVFAVNKSDRDGADAAVADLQQMIALGGVLAHAGSRPAHTGHGHGGVAAIMRPETGGLSERGWEPLIIKTVASRAEGVEDLLRACAAHADALDASGEAARRANERRERRFLTLARELLFEEASLRHAHAFAEALDSARSGEVDAYTAAAALLARAIAPADAGASSEATG